MAREGAKRQAISKLVICSVCGREYTVFRRHWDKSKQVCPVCRRDHRMATVVYKGRDGHGG
jgi:hypothetical protein